MKKLDRRQFCSALGGVAALAASVEAQSPSAPPLGSSGGPAATSGIGPPRAIALEQMQSHKTASGESWTIIHGALATGETVNLHQSMQLGGAPPAQPHVIQHTEFVLVREGELEFLHELSGQMQSEKVGPGGVIYIAFGTRHAIRNAGSAPARYFVVAIGGDAK